MVEVEPKLFLLPIQQLALGPVAALMALVAAMLGSIMRAFGSGLDPTSLTEQFTQVRAVKPLQDLLHVLDVQCGLRELKQECKTFTTNGSVLNNLLL